MPTLDEIIARAQADKVRAEREIAKANDTIAARTADLHRIRGFLTTLMVYGVEAGAADGPGMELSPKRERGKAAAAVSVAIGYINRNGPTNLPPLIGAVKEAGIEIGGDEKARMASYMSRDDRVYHQAPNGWFVKDVQTNNGPDAPTTEESDPLSVFSNNGGSHGTALA